VASTRLDLIDDKIGAGVERLVVAHHRHRLKRVGWDAALEPPDDGLWCSGDPPPRRGNALELLVDGAEALPRIAETIAGARESVLVAGWAFDPSFRLGPDQPTVRELLGAAAEQAQVRVLAWAGAPLPLFSPSRSAVREARERLVKGTRIRMALDSRERPLHCHHEKIVVVDGRIAFVGGIDLTALAGDRHDTSTHPARGALGWHDAALRLEGPIVDDVAAHVALRWQEVTGESLTPACNKVSQAGLDAQFVRTVPDGIYEALPRGDFRVLEAYVRALRSAERLIYLESQFLWSPEIVEILEAKLREPPSDEFRLVIVLPARPNNGADDTRGQLGQLVLADADERLLACTLYQPGEAESVYVHAKVGIVDDRWLCVGSANLNEHSLFNDTEACVLVCDGNFVRSARERLWREHLEREDVSGEPHRIVDELWSPLAREGRERRRREGGAPHRLSLLPHVSRRSRAFLGPLNSLLVDG
jgi:phosphatidylserine/phosphatidylglycerophosphate/cardiolipin synthase-like enzyme